jgi:hypothetical protein
MSIFYLQNFDWFRRAEFFGYRLAFHLKKEGQEKRVEKIEEGGDEL